MTRRGRLAAATGSRPAAADRQPLLDQTPQPLGQQQREGDRGGAQADQIPGALIGEPVLDREEDRGPDERSLEGAQAADQHHEDHVRRPLHAEDAEPCGWTNRVLASVSAPAAPQPKEAQHEQRRLLRVTRTPTGRGGLLVVADGLQRGAVPAAQQGEEEAQQQPPKPRVSQYVYAWRSCGLKVFRPSSDVPVPPPRSLVQRDQQRERLGHHPGADRELATAQAQHQQGNRQRDDPAGRARRHDREIGRKP